MFTLKHVTPDGAEALIATTGVSYTPTKPAYDIEQANGRYWMTTGTVWWENNTELVPLRDGVVYVMNDSGATVSKYELGHWQE